MIEKFLLGSLELAVFLWHFFLCVCIWNNPVVKLESYQEESCRIFFHQEIWLVVENILIVHIFVSHIHLYT